jgi:thiol-disulfide isomerase/thioredoxin
MHGTRRHWLSTCAGAGAAWLVGGLLPSAQAAVRARPSPAFEALAWPARQPVPKLEASDLDGKLWRLQDLPGRAVVLNFWASWSGPCLDEMPSLQVLADLYGSDKLLVLAVNVRETESRAAEFAKAIGISLPVLLDPEGEAARKWNVRNFPNTFLIGADGRPHARVRGGVEWSSPPALRQVEPLFRRPHRR